MKLIKLTAYGKRHWVNANSIVRIDALGYPDYGPEHRSRVTLDNGDVLLVEQEAEDIFAEATAERPPAWDGES
jgi:uncharacterized protein YlzI (FlbEa/FlbD family)